jgi:undecaprenyl diphosphate synthase
MSSENTTPTCVGVILDGNRRWAKERNLHTLEGHKKGYENLRELAEWTREAGIPHLVVYAFSTENWKRTAEEVGYLMDMMRTELMKRFSELRNEDTAVHVVGDMSMLPADIQDLVQELHKANAADAPYHVWVAVSYGGRAEIVSAVNALLAEGVTQVSEEEFASTLWTAGMPDPDLIIRTGGNHRLSNFLTWASVYAELFFVDTFWPAFTKEEYLHILETFAIRGRNFGK